MDFIKKLQNRPEQERKQFAVFISAILILVVVGIWALQLKHTLRAYTTQTPLASTAQEDTRTSSPMGTLFYMSKDTIGELFSVSYEQFTAASQNVRNFLEEIAYNEEQLNI